MHAGHYYLRNASEIRQIRALWAKWRWKNRFPLGLLPHFARGACASLIVDRLYLELAVDAGGRRFWDVVARLIPKTGTFRSPLEGLAVLGSLRLMVTFSKL